ncbi:MAG TPA: hypothetical protein VGM77_02950 [Gemmatimonadales bacterium]|jgi:hypothetical protein
MKAVSLPAGIEVLMGGLVVFGLGGGVIAAHAGTLMWIELICAGVAGWLARRRGRSGFLAGGIVAALGLSALLLAAAGSSQPAFVAATIAAGIPRALIVLAAGATVGWAGGVIWAVRREPHLWT